MRKLLSLFTISSVLAIAAGVSASGANALTLTNTSLKVEKTSFVQKACHHADYQHHHHCWMHYGHRLCEW
jgi:hypothetical protein